MDTVLSEFNSLYEELLMETLLNPEWDKSCLLEISVGSGGKEAEDWSKMVEDMLISYTNKNFKVKLLDRGVKSVSYLVEGKFAYAWLKSEEGVHRLSRVSPYGGGNKRQTSFCAVKLIPKVEDIKNDLLDKDLEIKTFKSSGPGGQHVNKTDSAVRILHKPTGISAACRRGRSQHQNKKTAMMMLQIKVDNYYREKNKVEVKDNGAASFGNHIRTYVMDPYQLVSDHRSGFNQKNLYALEGNLEEFSRAYLKTLVK